MSDVSLRSVATTMSSGAPIGTSMQAADYGEQGITLAYNPAGTILATGNDDGTLRLWDPASSSQIGPTTTEPHDHGENAFYGVSTVAFSLDGSRLASGDDGAVRLWDPATSRQIGSPIIATPFLPDALVNSSVKQVAFLHNGALLATLSELGQLRYWDADTHQEITTPALATPPCVYVSAIAVDPTGTIIAAADSDGIIRQWTPTTGRAIGSPIRYTNGSVHGLVFSPDGTLLATAVNSTLRLWDPATGQPVGVPMTTDTLGVPPTMIVFNPRSTVLATVANNWDVRQWHLALWRDPYRALCQEVGSPTIYQ